MRINDFKEMQQNLEQMRHNLEDIKKVDYIQPDLGKKRGKARRAVQKKISEIVHPKLFFQLVFLLKQSLRMQLKSRKLPKKMNQSHKCKQQKRWK